MSGAALALALSAAILHKLWNLLLAGSRDVLAATGVALGASLVLAAPFAALTWEVEREAVPWLVASGALELVYFFTLTAAYARAELSLVYPLARRCSSSSVRSRRGWRRPHGKRSASSRSQRASCSCAA